MLGEERVWATGRRDERGIPRDAGGGKRVEQGDRAGGGRCAHLRSVADGDGAVLGGEQIFAKLTGAMGRLPTGTVQRSALFGQSGIVTLGSSPLPRMVVIIAPQVFISAPTSRFDGERRCAPRRPVRALCVAKTLLNSGLFPDRHCSVSVVDSKLSIVSQSHAGGLLCL